MQLWFLANRRGSSFRHEAGVPCQKILHSSQFCFRAALELRDDWKMGSWPSDLPLPLRHNYWALYWKIAVFALLPTGCQKVCNAVSPSLCTVGWANVCKTENLAPSFQAGEETKYSNIFHKSQMDTLMWVPCNIISNRRIRKSGEKGPFT